MIETRNLTKEFDGKPILLDVSVQFPKGKITALIGPNGAGKSTLLTAMGRLIEPNGGQIFIDGQPVSGIRHVEYAKCVATMRQFPDINLRLSVEELVGFGRFPYSRGTLTRDDEVQVTRAIEFLSLSALRGALIDQLSGGQRQLAFLAMTIAQQTDYLLLDEPLNNLDMKHSVQLMQALRRLCDEHERTVIMVVHDINFAVNYSDCIVALKNGRLQFSGAVDDVISEASLKDLYELDFEISQSESVFLCNYFKPTGETA